VNISFSRGLESDDLRIAENSSVCGAKA
jgi:hypothetical protein